MIMHGLLELFGDVDVYMWLRKSHEDLLSGSPRPAIFFSFHIVALVCSGAWPWALEWHMAHDPESAPMRSPRL